MLREKAECKSCQVEYVLIDLLFVKEWEVTSPKNNITYKVALYKCPRGHGIRVYHRMD